MLRSFRHGSWALLLAPAVAMAGSIFLNGVNIDGVTNQKFDRATIRIDEKGNVFIDAPGYAVKAVQGGPTGTTGAGQIPTASTGQVTRRYWLVTEQSVPGMTEFDIDVYVNAKWLRKLKNSEDQIVTEITKSLQPGDNAVLLVAHKSVMGSAPKSLSPEHFFQVIIGEGNVGGDNVMIDRELAKFKVTAHDGSDVSKEFHFSTR